MTENTQGSIWVTIRIQDKANGVAFFIIRRVKNNRTRERAWQVFLLHICISEAKLTEKNVDVFIYLVKKFGIRIFLRLL